MAVSKRTRYEVLKRDNYACRYCGAGAPEAKLTIDHVVPVALGGSDAPDNLVAACVDCNAGKSSTSPTEETVTEVSQEALRWSAAMKVAAERLSKREEPTRVYVAEVERELETYRMDPPRTDYCFDLPFDWRESAVQFYRAGLPAERLVHAVAVAISKRHVSQSSVWRYACGVAWTMVRDLQTEARAVLDEDAL